jgi:hypothetical protein
MSALLRRHKQERRVCIARSSLLISRDSDAESIRQQNGQGRICQDVLGRPAEYHLS